MLNGVASRAVVIGGGFGGLAAAIRLQARGYQTTLLESRDRPGGRAYVYEQDGFKFDAGPTIITIPFLVDELFALGGRKTSDYVDIFPCDPYYRIIFHDGRVFDYTGDESKIEEQIRGFNPADVEGYRRFLKKTEKLFDRGFTDLSDHPFSSFWDMMKVAPDLVRLGSHESVFKLVSRHIRDPHLQQVFSFNPLLIGGNPFQASSLYAMIHFLERKWGIHSVRGGTGALVNALVQLFQEMGGVLRCGARVDRIVVEAGRVCGVEVAGARFPADVVVSNADVANTYRKLIDPKWRRKWTDRRLEKMRYSMSLFMIYFGTNRTYPNLAHHTILLGPRYRGLLDDIFHHKILAKDFSLYLHAPTRSDPSVAPHGCECFYALSPVPNLQGDIDWQKEKEAYADAILASLETHCPDLRKHIVTRRIITPEHFQNDLESYAGSAFSFEPVLTQSAWFRPHNVSEDVKGLFFAGAGTHPGAGVPGVISSAKLLDKVIPAPSRLSGTPG
jgi:phytoene desaturase